MENNNRIIITRSGRHARQLSFLYQNRIPRKGRRMEEAGQDDQQNVMNIERERRETANEREQFRLMREEMERNLVELRNQQRVLQQQAVQQQAQWQMFQQHQTAQLQQQLGNA